MARIYYAGDWAVQLGPVYAESAFHHSVKGTEIFNYGKWLKEALESTGEHQVTSVPSWDFYMLKPGEYENILATYDAVIFSDLEARNFQLRGVLQTRTVRERIFNVPGSDSPDHRSRPWRTWSHVSGGLAEFQRRPRNGWLGTMPPARTVAGDLSGI